MGCTEHAEVGSVDRFGLVGKHQRKELERFFRRPFRANPNPDIPLRPRVSQSQGQRTADQPRAENGDRAQGTKKILFV